MKSVPTLYITSLPGLAMYVAFYIAYLDRSDLNYREQDARTLLPKLGKLANEKMKILIWVSNVFCTQCLTKIH
jgi:hypothetical protein